MSAKRVNGSPRGSIDRLPPHSVEAEQAVLGSILLDYGKAMPVCLDLLREDGAFYDMRHETIYKVCCEMFEKREPIDVITLQQKLKDKQLLQQVGGLDYLAQLPDCSPSALNVEYHLGTMIEKWLLRRAIKVCTEAVGSIYEDETQPEAQIDALERDVLAIRSLRARSHALHAKELSVEAIHYIEQMHEKGGHITGLPTGFVDLDKMTMGLQPGEMTVLAAYPSFGKTSLAMNIAEFVAVEYKLPVGVFSVEMSGLSLALRMLCSRARVNLRNVREGFLAEREFPKITHAAGKLANSTLFVDDCGDLTVQQLRARGRRMWQQYGIKLFVVDYLQLLSAPSQSRRSSESRQEEVATISRGIKTLARELGVHILVLSQLNDDGKLRESRAIGQDADGVWYLEESQDDDEHSEARPMTLRIGKQRNGPTGTVPLVFMKCYTRFESAAKVEDESYGRQQEL